MDPITISARMQIPTAEIMVVWFSEQNCVTVSVSVESGDWHLFTISCVIFVPGKLVATPDNFRAKKEVNRSLEVDKGNVNGFLLTRSHARSELLQISWSPLKKCFSSQKYAGVQKCGEFLSRKCKNAGRHNFERRICDFSFHMCGMKTGNLLGEEDVELKISGWQKLQRERREFPLLLEFSVLNFGACWFSRFGGWEWGEEKRKHLIRGRRS